MRLTLLDSGHTQVQKVFLSILRRAIGSVPGPVAVMSYRPSLFGRAFTHLAQRAMRHAEYWTTGELEAMAAFVSKQNQCAFCTDSHAATAAHIWNDRRLVDQVLLDPEHASVPKRLRLILPLLGKVTKSPQALSQDDFAALLDKGLAHEAIEEALLVTFVFNVINRLADAFGFPELDQASHDRGAQFLTRLGYRAACIPGGR